MRRGARLRGSRRADRWAVRRFPWPALSVAVTVLPGSGAVLPASVAGPSMSAAVLSASAAGPSVTALSVPVTVLSASVSVSASLSALSVPWRCVGFHGRRARFPWRRGGARGGWGGAGGRPPGEAQQSEGCRRAGRTSRFGRRGGTCPGGRGAPWCPPYRERRRWLTGWGEGRDDLGVCGSAAAGTRGAGWFCGLLCGGAARAPRRARLCRGCVPVWHPGLDLLGGHGQWGMNVRTQNGFAGVSDSEFFSGELTCERSRP